MQPDSLKLASQLAILKLLQRTALSLDENLGDKASGRAFFIKGIQGEVWIFWLEFESIQTSYHTGIPIKHNVLCQSCYYSGTYSQSFHTSQALPLSS